MEIKAKPILILLSIMFSFTWWMIDYTKLKLIICVLSTIRLGMIDIPTYYTLESIIRFLAYRVKKTMMQAKYIW